jgi:hypothetical protein
LRGRPWDLILGSIHWVDEGAVDNDLYSAFDHIDSEALWRGYVDRYTRAAMSGQFDVMTHSDLPKSFGPLPSSTTLNWAYDSIADALAEAGVCAAIVPDLPLEESGPWCKAADAAGIETVMLAAPTAPDERLPRILERVRGFVYAVGLLGVTGERDELASTALLLARRLKQLTSIPILIGVGVSNAEQAAEAVTVADGVVQGASVMRRLLEDGPDAVGEYVAEVRAAIDRVPVAKG